MKGLSKKEIQVISDLEFRKKYYFTTEDIRKHFKKKREIIVFIYRLRKKGRAVKLNKSKYYLIPIKARTGAWSDYSFIIVDEILNGSDYLIGGWSAANYWRLTDQIPMQVDVYTTKKQGKIKVLSTKIVFHRTTKKRISKAVVQEIENHAFRILSREDSKKWLKSRK